MKPTDRLHQGEPLGSVVREVSRHVGYNDYELLRDVHVPALSREEALAWLECRKRKLRGATLYAVMYFLRHSWQLKSGWRVGVRRITSWHSKVVWGRVDALGRFIQRDDDTCTFSHHRAGLVIDLIIERIEEAAKQQAF